MSQSASPQKAYDLGYAYEQKYGNCAQCILAAIQDTFTIVDDEVFKAAHGLAGGLGLSGRGTCGALSGGALALSSRYGRERQNFAGGSYRQSNALVKRLFDRFVAEFGSPICAEVQRRIMGRSFNLWDAAERQQFEEAGGHNDKCPAVVGKTARWVAEILLETEEMEK